MKLLHSMLIAASISLVPASAIAGSEVISIGQEPPVDVPILNGQNDPNFKKAFRDFKGCETEFREGRMMGDGPEYHACRKLRDELMVHFADESYLAEYRQMMKNIDDGVDFDKSIIRSEQIRMMGYQGWLEYSRPMM